ncbi:MAG: sensor domain-containing diguanylate cyclase, partial [Anaerolineales bacterium]|nr:sensor domain-containing diguanylate cyclase [Anaerolineales bacterium]
RDGVLVVDESNQIVDINQSAEKMLVIKGRYHIGEPVQDILPIWDGLTANIGEKDVTTEISVGDHDPRVIEVHISPLYNQRQRFIGRLVALHDITTKKQISDALDKANQNLKLQITEIEALQADLQEQAVRDHLTGLVNRRFLEETLDGELPRAVRKGYPVCIALIDLDHLKGLNDKHGHAAGDAMLQAVGKLLQKKTRQGDFVCRYGGDEFVVVFPDATIPTAYKRIEQLRAACEDFEVKYGEESLSLSLTAGIAAFPQHGSTAGEVLHHADQALYQAKSAGRNCIMVWGEAIAVTVA